MVFLTPFVDLLGDDVVLASETQVSVQICNRIIHIVGSFDVAETVEFAAQRKGPGSSIDSQTTTGSVVFENNFVLLLGFSDETSLNISRHEKLHRVVEPRFTKTTVSLAVGKAGSVVESNTLLGFRIVEYEFDIVCRLS
ncbi:hypothetical protein HG530_007605 [Fusarium avenaceum]|nr:hypothetical protein HG530_007605 [Fusarium avenaceum]